METTLGQKRVRKGFNPNGNALVDELKTRVADFIDRCEELKQASDDPEVERLAALAQTEAESAAMWAVKAATAGT